MSNNNVTTALVKKTNVKLTPSIIVASLRLMIQAGKETWINPKNPNLDSVALNAAIKALWIALDEYWSGKPGVKTMTEEEVRSIIIASLNNRKAA